MRHTPKRPQDRAPTLATIESLAQDGRGVAHIDGKTVFIHGALPGERVQFTYERIQRNFDAGHVQSVLEPATTRIVPRCPHFGVCGGCCLQHLEATAQIRAKEQVLRDALEHIGKVQPQHGYLPPLTAQPWGYRRKARLGVKYVEAKSKLLIGFRERNSAFVTDLHRCEILHPTVGERLELLRTVIEQLSIRKQIPQIEVAMGDADCVLIIRVLSNPNEQDKERLRQFATQYGLYLYLQTGGPQQLEPLTTAADLTYSLPELNLRLKFQPLDFTQVNLELNRLLIAQVLKLLNPQPQERILDLFCGIGNFTLPLATRAHAVIGVEGDAGLVARANANAVANGITNCQFHTTDLYAALNNASWLNAAFDTVVLDPPRSGAMQILPHLPKLGARQILYISCLPATLARDAGILVNELGFKLSIAGVMDMFPHTAHVESLAVFER